MLQTGKREVGIDAVEPVGNYAVLIRFSDGHDTGIYSRELLYRPGDQQESLWLAYPDRPPRPAPIATPRCRWLPATPAATTTEPHPHSLESDI